MEIIQKNIDELKPYKNNPRHNDVAVEAVANSIKEFGFKVPIILDKDDEIIAGHTRLKAAKQLGLEDVPCIIADDLTDEQIKAFRLADNKVAELADWDFDSLKAELEELDGMDLDFDMADFGFEEFDDIDDVVEDEYEIDIPEETTIKAGDIYQLGRHRLMCGDSTDPDNVKRLVGGVMVDMFLTDPPYNVNYNGKTKDNLKIKNDDMEDKDFREFLIKAFSCANDVMKEGAVYYIWHADSEGYNFRGACKEVGWTVRQCLIWNKNSLVVGRQDYQWKHEPCLYGWKDGAGHLWASDRKQTTVIDMDRPLKSELHPTMKPIALFDYQIKNNTKGGDVVLDLFGGFRVIIVIEANSYVNIRSSRLLPKFKTQKINSWCAA